jgi:hypothetical protein
MTGGVDSAQLIGTLAAQPEAHIATGGRRTYLQQHDNEESQPVPSP